MKKLLVAMSVALLLAGCGEKQGEDSPESNQTSTETPPDANEIRNKIIAEAIDY